MTSSSGVSISKDRFNLRLAGAEPELQTRVPTMSLVMDHASEHPFESASKFEIRRASDVILKLESMLSSSAYAGTLLSTPRGSMTIGAPAGVVVQGLLTPSAYGNLVPDASTFSPSLPPSATALATAFLTLSNLLAHPASVWPDDQAQGWDAGAVDMGELTCESVRTAVLNCASYCNLSQTARSSNPHVPASALSLHVAYLELSNAVYGTSPVGGQTWTDASGRALLVLDSDGYIEPLGGYRNLPAANERVSGVVRLSSSFDDSNAAASMTALNSVRSSITSATSGPIYRTFNAAYTLSGMSLVNQAGPMSMTLHGNGADVTVFADGDTGLTGLRNSSINNSGTFGGGFLVVKETLHSNTNSNTNTATSGNSVLEYPPADLVSTSCTLSGQMYGCGKYVATASSSAHTAWGAWSQGMNWTSSTSYSATDGQPTSAAAKEWLQLALPEHVSVVGINLGAATNVAAITVVLVDAQNGTMAEVWSGRVSEGRNIFSGISESLQTASVFRLRIDAVAAGQTRAIVNAAKVLARPALATLTISETSCLWTGAALGLGVVEKPAASLHLSKDSAVKPGSSTWTVPSDARLKTQIAAANLDACYDLVKNIQLSSFRDDESATSNRLGWIAQDVEASLPDCVTVAHVQGLEDCKLMNADQIIASLYGCVQKLMQKVEALEQQ